MADYYLLGRECHPLEHILCYLIRRLADEERDDYAVMRVQPPLWMPRGKSYYGFQKNQDIHHVLLLSECGDTTVFDAGWQELPVRGFAPKEEAVDLAVVENLADVALEYLIRGTLYRRAPLPDEVYLLIREIRRWGRRPELLPELGGPHPTAPAGQFAPSELRHLELESELRKGDARRVLRKFPVEELRRIRDELKQEARRRGWEVD